MLTVAVDYDDTITSDVSLWLQIISLFKSNGWSVMIVTGRRNTISNRQEIEQCVPGVPVYFAYDQPKRDFMDSHGISIDVWIDDVPEMIIGDLSGDVSRLKNEVYSMGVAQGVAANVIADLTQRLASAKAILLEAIGAYDNGEPCIDRWWCARAKDWCDE